MWFVEFCSQTERGKRRKFIRDGCLCLKQHECDRHGTILCFLTQLRARSADINITSVTFFIVIVNQKGFKRFLFSPDPCNVQAFFFRPSPSLGCFRRSQIPRFSCKCLGAGNTCPGAQRSWVTACCEANNGKNNTKKTRSQSDLCSHTHICIKSFSGSGSPAGSNRRRYFFFVIFLFHK